MLALVSGPISYKKIVLDLESYEDGTPIHKVIHLFGDVHVTASRCSEASAIPLEKIVERTLLIHKEKDIPIDVFCEVQLGRMFSVNQVNDDYLDTFYNYFYTHYGCFDTTKDKCNSYMSPHRFHNIDFRHTLYVDMYKTLSIIHDPRQFTNHTYSAYEENVQSVKTKIEELVRLVPELSKIVRFYIWIHFVVSIRGLYVKKCREHYKSQHPRTTEAQLDVRYKSYYKILDDGSTYDFVLDLYYAMIKKTYPMPSMKTIIDKKFPDQPIPLPFYMERYTHVISKLPSRRLQEVTTQLVMEVITTLKTSHNETDFISLSYNDQISNAVFTSIVLMDLYSILRICKPTYNNIIIYEGQEHTTQMVTLCTRLSELYGGGASIQLSNEYGSDKNVNDAIIIVENINNVTISAHSIENITIRHFNDPTYIRFFRKNTKKINITPNASGPSVDILNYTTPTYTQVGTQIYEMTLRVENKSGRSIVLSNNSPLYITPINQNVQCIHVPLETLASTEPDTTYLPCLTFSDNVTFEEDSAVDIMPISTLPSFANPSPIPSVELYHKKPQVASDMGRKLRKRKQSHRKKK